MQGDFAAVTVGDVQRDRQAEADAAGCDIAGRFQAEERAEHVFAAVGRNTGPIVIDGDGGDALTP